MRLFYQYKSSNQDARILLSKGFCHRFLLLCRLYCIQADKQRRKLYASSFYILNKYIFTLINSSRFLYLVLLICCSAHIMLVFLFVDSMLIFYKYSFKSYLRRIFFSISWSPLFLLCSTWGQFQDVSSSFLSRSASFLHQDFLHGKPQFSIRIRVERKWASQLWGFQS